MLRSSALAFPTNAFDAARVYKWGNSCPVEGALHRDRRGKLLVKILGQGFQAEGWPHRIPLPVVELEDFFEDNPCPHSIAPNLIEHPGLQFFYERLIKIRARKDVQDVLVNIFDMDDIIDYKPNAWPGTENAHILTSAPEAQVQLWADELLSDGAIEGWPYGEPAYAPKPKPGFKWWSVCWD